MSEICQNYYEPFSFFIYLEKISGIFDDYKNFSITNNISNRFAHTVINAIKSNETDYSWRTQNGTRKYIFIWSFKMILQISPSQSLTSNQSLIIFLAIEYFNESFESVNSLFEYLTFTGETIYATWAQNNHEVLCLNNAIDGN